MKGIFMDRCLIVLAAVISCSCLPNLEQPDMSPTSTNQLRDIHLKQDDHTNRILINGMELSTNIAPKNSESSSEISNCIDEIKAIKNEVFELRYFVNQNWKMNSRQRREIKQEAIPSSCSCIGNPGPKGEPGLDGIHGLNGEPGCEETGSPGTGVKNGANGLDERPRLYSSPGLDGRPGRDGRPGLDGRIGLTGPKGESGQPGIKGDSGTTGSVGSVGSPGPPGQPGLSGPPGPPGQTGREGSTGQSGPNGPSGPKGAYGPSGSRGPQGPSGSRGSDGSQGPQGSQGPPGLNGAQGPSGLQGAQGPQGPPGPSGPKGSEAALGSKGTGWNVPGGQYLGCYQDQAVRTLPHHFASFGSHNSPSKCIAHCRGYRYAGVQYSDQCFCGHSLPPTKVLEISCSMSCPGSSSYFCGGWFTSNVYQLN